MRFYFSPVGIVINGKEQLMRAAVIENNLDNAGAGRSRHHGLIVLQQWDGAAWRQIPMNFQALDWLETKLDGCMYRTWYYVVAPRGAKKLEARPADIRLGLEGLVETNGPKTERPGARRKDGVDPYRKGTEL